MTDVEKVMARGMRAHRRATFLDVSPEKDAAVAHAALNEAGYVVVPRDIVDVDKALAWKFEEVREKMLSAAQSAPK